MLPRQPLLPAGSVQLPRFAAHSWLLGDSGRQGDWTLMDVGLLVGLLGAFQNHDASIIVGARFEESDDGEPTLVAPCGVGSDLRLFGKVEGSPVEVLIAGRWLESRQNHGQGKLVVAGRLFECVVGASADRASCC